MNPEEFKKHIDRLTRNDPELVKLNLCYKPLAGDQITALAEALKANSTLHTLYLGSNQIGDAGIEKLAEALKANRTLHTLYLGGNQIGAAGIEKLAEALKANRTLQTLYLGGNQIGAVGIE